MKYLGWLQVFGEDEAELAKWMLAFKKAARIAAAIPVGAPLTPGANELWKPTEQEVLDPQRVGHQ